MKEGMGRGEREGMGKIIETLVAKLTIPRYVCVCVCVCVCV